MLHTHNTVCAFSWNQALSYYRPSFILTTASQSLYYFVYSVNGVYRTASFINGVCVLLNCVLENLGTGLFISQIYMHVKFFMHFNWLTSITFFFF